MRGAFLDSKPWLGLIMVVVGLCSYLWLRWKIKRAEHERIALEAEETLKRQRANEEATKANIKQKARERLLLAADEIQKILKLLQNDWEGASEETWRSFESLIYDIRDTALELPPEEVGPWHNYALEFYLICKFGSGHFANNDAAERRVQLRGHCSHVSAIVDMQLKEDRRRFAPA